MPTTLCSLDRLMTLLHQIKPLSQALEASIVNGFERVNLKKGRTILSAGEHCNYLWYLADGLVRSGVAYTNEEEETTTRIMLPEHIIISIYSYYENEPSKETYQNVILFS